MSNGKHDCFGPKEAPPHSESPDSKRDTLRSNGGVNKRESRMEADVSIPTSAYFTGFLREIEEHGETWWVLYDFDGVAVFKAKERAHCYYFAHDHDVKVMMRN